MMVGSVQMANFIKWLDHLIQDHGEESDIVTWEMIKCEYIPHPGSYKPKESSCE